MIKFIGKFCLNYAAVYRYRLAVRGYKFRISVIDGTEVEV